MRDENTIGKESGENVKLDDNESDLDQKKAGKAVASAEEITATVRIKSIRGSTSAEKKKKEQDDECKQTTHAILATLFICQALIIIFSFHNIYSLTSSSDQHLPTTEL